MVTSTKNFDLHECFECYNRLMNVKRVSSTIVHARWWKSDWHDRQKIIYLFIRLSIFVIL